LEHWNDWFWALDIVDSRLSLGEVVPRGQEVRGMARCAGSGGGSRGPRILTWFRPASLAW